MVYWLLKLFGEVLENSSYSLKCRGARHSLHLAQHFLTEKRKAGTPVHEPFVHFYFVHGSLYLVLLILARRSHLSFV